MPPLACAPKPPNLKFVSVSSLSTKYDVTNHAIAICL